MRRFFFLFTLLFCILFVGCLSLDIDSKAEIVPFQNTKIFVESNPSQRPSWVDSVPSSDTHLYFIGTSNYLANETSARNDARQDAFSQIIKYYGTVIKSTASETKSVKALSSDVIDPYIESEELLQSFAERYVSEILTENYFTEKYLINGNQEQWVCYVKCSVLKEKVKQEIDSFAADISERYSSLLPERQSNKYNSLSAAVSGYLSVYKAITENPIYQAVAYVETSSGKSALDEYAIMQAKRLILNCKMQTNDYEAIVEKGNNFKSNIIVLSSDYENISGMKTNVYLSSNGNILAKGNGNINSNNIIEVKIDTSSLDYGRYSLKIDLVNDIGSSILGENTVDSILLPFEVVPIYAGIKFIYYGDVEFNEQIEQKISDVLRDLIQKNNINIYIYNTKLKNNSCVFEVYLNSDKLVSHESVVKIKVVGNISFKKNGLIQVKSKNFEGLGLSKDVERSVVSAIEAAISNLYIDNDFFNKIKSITLGA